MPKPRESNAEVLLQCPPSIPTCSIGSVRCKLPQTSPGAAWARLSGSDAPAVR